MTRFLLPATAILALTGIAQAQTGVAPANPAVTAPIAAMVDSSPATQPVAAMPPAGGYDLQTEDAIRQRFWGGAEYLLWWVQGQRIPALATTSAPGTPLTQAGVIGAPCTAVLFGNSRITDSAASGFRVYGGLWLDDCQRCGIGAEFFLLQNLSTSFSAQSPGSPILARPFVNALTGGQDSQVIAYPGLAAGSIAAHGESQLLGASAYARHILCSS
ncbi:MAG TPA: BBP7 family outer membrane beta-barrel protein, partial [Gemmata sp.]|nr:BBP7 family outer membrane beta-barrel protein [Gemmata sp.]